MKRVIKNKINSFFSLSVNEIAVAGLLTSVIILVGYFIRLELGVMRVGLTYPLFIVVGLILKPFLGIIVAIISDNILLALGPYGFSNWIWAYAIIPIFIYLTSFFFKKLITHEKEKTWFLTMILSMIVITTFMIILISINKDFSYKTSNSELAISMDNLITKILIWTFLGIIVFFQLISMFYYIRTKNKKVKFTISIFTLVLLVTVTTIWIWGPISQVLWLNRFGSYRNIKNSYWELYDIYLIARILKTPLIIAIYVSIIIPMYIASKVMIKKENKWI